MFMWLTILFGIILAAIDCSIEYSLTKYVHVPGCATIGCFASPKYKIYWGASNMVLDGTVLVLTIIVGVQLKKLKKKTAAISIAHKENTQVEQVNKLSMGILIVGVLFLLIPSAIVGIVEFLGLGIFKSFGPFYTLGLLLAGVANSFLYIGLHLELREAAKKLVFGNKAGVPCHHTTTKPTSRVFSVQKAESQTHHRHIIIKQTGNFFHPSMIHGQ